MVRRQLTIATEQLLILNWEGSFHFYLIFGSFVFPGYSDLCMFPRHFSYRQAETDCTSAINLDSKVRETFQKFFWP
jgi:hypothetical protein